MKDNYEVLYTTGAQGIKMDFVPQAESDLEGFYVRNGRYAIMAARDLHVFGITYKKYSEALEEAESYALMNPGEKYIVIYLDTTAKAEVPKAITTTLSPVTI